MAVEAALLGAKVTVVEMRDYIARNNVLHLWPFVIHDLKALGARRFSPKFCSGSVEHVSKYSVEKNGRVKLRETRKSSCETARGIPPAAYVACPAGGVDRHTDTSENITFSQPSDADGKKGLNTVAHI